MNVAPKTALVIMASVLCTFTHRIGSQSSAMRPTANPELNHPIIDAVSQVLSGRLLIGDNGVTLKFGALETKGKGVFQMYVLMTNPDGTEVSVPQLYWPANGGIVMRDVIGSVTTFYKAYLPEEGGIGIVPISASQVVSSQCKLENRKAVCELETRDNDGKPKSTWYREQ